MLQAFAMKLSRRASDISTHWPALIKSEKTFAIAGGADGSPRGWPSFRLSEGESVHAIFAGLSAEVQLGVHGVGAVRAGGE